MPLDLKDRKAADQLILDIQALESRAHRLGLHATGHALNSAKNAIGWEMAGEPEKAGMAARGDDRVRMY